VFKGGINCGKIMLVYRHKRVARQPKSFCLEDGFRYPVGVLMTVSLPVANIAEWDLWYCKNNPWVSIFYPSVRDNDISIEIESCFTIAMFLAVPFHFQPHWHLKLVNLWSIAFSFRVFKLITWWYCQFLWMFSFSSIPISMENWWNDIDRKEPMSWR
jgi:hypothetical protein